MSLFPPELSSLADDPAWVKIADDLRVRLEAGDDETQAYEAVFHETCRPMTAGQVKVLWAPAVAAAGFTRTRVPVDDNETVKEPSPQFEVLLEDVSDVMAIIVDHHIRVQDSMPAVREVFDPPAPSRTQIIVAAVASVVFVVAAAVFAGSLPAVVAAVMIAVFAIVSFFSRRSRSVAFEDEHMWLQRRGGWLGPIDLGRIDAVYAVTTTSVTQLCLLQQQVGTTLKARRSHGFDAPTVERLNQERTLRAVTIQATPRTIHPEVMSRIAGYITASSAIIDPTAARIFDRYR